MVFCKNCGAQFIDETKFCSSCGAGVDDSPQTQQNWEQAPPTGGQSPPMAGASSMNNEKDIQDNKVMAVLAYIGLLVLVPIFAAKESRFARYHANQGLVLLIAWTAYYIVFRIIAAMLTAFFFATWSGLGLIFIVTGFLWLVFFVFFVFAVIGVVNALKGEFKPLPVIGGFKILPE